VKNIKICKVNCGINAQHFEINSLTALDVCICLKTVVACIGYSALYSQ